MTSNPPLPPDGRLRRRAVKRQGVRRTAWETTRSRLLGWYGSVLDG